MGGMKEHWRIFGARKYFSPKLRPQGWASLLVKDCCPPQNTDHFGAYVWSFPISSKNRPGMGLISCPFKWGGGFVQNRRVGFIWPILDVPVGLKGTFPTALPSTSLAIISAIPKFYQCWWNPDTTPGLPAPFFCKTSGLVLFLTHFGGVLHFFSGACQVARSEKPPKVKEAAFRACPRRSPGEKRPCGNTLRCCQKNAKKGLILLKILLLLRPPRKLWRVLSGFTSFGGFR